LIKIGKCLLPLSSEYFHLLTKHLNIKIYKIMILNVILYGCEIWSLILMEEKVFQIKVLMRILEIKRKQQLEENAKFT